MEFVNEDVSKIWMSYGEERIEAFEAAYAQYGAKMFAFPSFFNVKEWSKKCLSLLNAPCLNQRCKTIKTIALYQRTYAFGGAERCISYLMPLFQSLGYRVLLITDLNEKTDAFPIPAGVKRLVLGEENTISGNPLPKKKFTTRCELWNKFIRDNKIDAVYYGFPVSSVRLLDFLSIRGAGAYVLYHYHSCFTHVLSDYNMNLFFDFANLIRFSDTIVGLSRIYSRFFQLCQARSYYVPNKCFFEKLPAPRSSAVSSRLNCLWCARIQLIKQPLEIIPIFARIYEKVPNATLTILGDAPTESAKAVRHKMETQARTLGCANAIEWAGFQADVTHYYQKADLLISTSQSEGFPLTHIEAYAYGLPIVSYDMPYLETLQNPKAARCVPQGDQQAAAEAAIGLLTNPEAYREASLEARKMAEEFMNFDQAAAWKKVIEELPQPYTPEETETDRIDRVMLETILLHGTWAKIPQQTEAQLQKTRKQLAAAQDEIKKIRTIKADPKGYLKTLIPRKLKGGIKCLRDNGLRYTLRRAIKKVLKR